MESLFHFQARVISGAGRGKGLGIPTLNFDLRDLPPELKEGVYAGTLVIDGTEFPAAMHYGPRPVFKDSLSFEAHLIDHLVDTAPETATIEIVEYLRPVMNFDSSAELVKQIQADVERCRTVLHLPDPQ